MTSTQLQELKVIHAIHVLFDSQELLLRFLFHHKKQRLRLGVDELLSEATELCHSDYLLVRVAIDLWCGEVEVKIKISTLLEVLDDRQFLNLLLSLAYMREFVEVREVLGALASR